MGKMEFEGKSIAEVIAVYKARIAEFEEKKKRNDYDAADIELNWMRELRVKDLELLQLTEEKRRLLTCIIEWMTTVVYKSASQGFVFVATILTFFLYLAELHKRVNSATTMEELAKISDELAKFKQEHPWLEL